MHRARKEEMLPCNRRLKEAARYLRKNMTEAEQFFWLKVRRKQLQGIQFYRQKNIGDYIVDFYCPARRLIFEIDGGQHYSEAGRMKDRLRDSYLSGLGFIVLRFSDREVLKDIDGVLERLYAYL